MTERYERERALADQAERLERFSVAFPDIAFIIDEEYRYRDYLSGTGQRDRFPVAPEEFLGQDIRAILPTSVADAHIEAITAVLETGEEQTVEYRLTVPAGERWFEGRIAPLPHDIDGKAGDILVASDVTERKAREEQLAVVRNRFLTLFENLPTPVVHVRMHDSKPIIEQVNRAFTATFGSSADGLHGEPLDTVTVPAEPVDIAMAMTRLGVGTAEGEHDGYHRPRLGRRSGRTRDCPAVSGLWDDRFAGGTTRRRLFGVGTVANAIARRRWMFSERTQ